MTTCGLDVGGIGIGCTVGAGGEDGCIAGCAVGAGCAAPFNAATSAARRTASAGVWHWMVTPLIVTEYI
jgi:hypothetical protein